MLFVVVAGSTSEMASGAVAVSLASFLSCKRVLLSSDLSSPLVGIGKGNGFVGGNY